MSTQNQWKRVPWATPDGFAFERPLGQNEQGFYWDTVFHRTADILRDAEVEVDPSSRERALLPSTLKWAWTTLKQRYPLLGASVEERSQDDIVFVVDPARLLVASPTEIAIEKVHSIQGVDEIVGRMHNGHSPLSNDLLACIRILERTDEPVRVHILIHSSHVMSDEIAHNTLLREYLQLLSDPDLSLVDTPMIDRLALSRATEDLHPHSNRSLARKRWRRAIGRIIIERRRRGQTGGHTLPRNITSDTTQTPAHSRATSSTFSTEDTKKLMQSCRANGLTFGSVLPILGQIAMARVLCKQYLQGSMSEDEWEFRKTEPMINAGPLNLRPFLDPQWFKDGGATNASLAIGYYFYQLPFIPLGTAAGLSPGSPLPSCFDMFSKARFIYRCQMMKRNIMEFMQHPLFFEMNESWLPARLHRLRGMALTMRAEGPPSGIDLESVSPQDQATRGYVMNHGGATLGNLDTVLPWEYNAELPTQALQLVRTRSFLHCRPTELYLGASTFRQQMKFHIFWDGNVYGENIVQGWLEELVECAKVYLAE